jgi:tetratricopeptide (TPR) repeat protein
MANEDVWTEILAGRFDEACSLADQVFSRTGDIFFLRNKVFALLHLGRFDLAAQTCRQIIELNPRNLSSASDYVRLGVSHWSMGLHEEAISDWRSGFDAIYADAAGGLECPLLVFFASEKLGDTVTEKEMLKRLRKRVKKGKIAGWPAPLANYILGDIDEEALFSHVVNIPSLKGRQHCQASFFAAVRSQRQDCTNRKFYLEDAVAQGMAASLEAEYYLAKKELETSNEKRGQVSLRNPEILSEVNSTF